MAGTVVDISQIYVELGIEASQTAAEAALAAVCLKKATAAVARYLRYDPVQATRTEFYPRQDSRGARSSVWEVSDTQAYQRYLSEASTDELQLQALPIRSVTSLFIDSDGRFGTKSGSFAASSEKTQGTDFWPQFDGVDSSGNGVCRDGILHSHGRWPTVAGSVKVVYVAGYTNAELNGEDSVVDATPIHEAVCDETTRRFLKIKQRSKKRLAGFAGPLSSEGLGDYNYSRDSGAMDKIISGGGVSPSSMGMLEEFVNLGVMLAG